MKRFLVLLVVLAGGLAWAAFSVPSNAATVNGTAISQQDLNFDVSAIANSAYYQCYLNSEEYLSSQGSAAIAARPWRRHRPVRRGPPDRHDRLRGQLPRDRHRPPAPAAAGRRAQCHVTQADLVTARTDLTGQISEVMSEILQTPAGPERSLRLQPDWPAADRAAGPGLHARLVRRPAGAVRGQASALEEDLAGVGSSAADLQSYFRRTARSSTRPASPQPSSRARARHRPARPRSPSALRSPRWRRAPAPGRRGAGLRRAVGPQSELPPSRSGEPGHRRRLAAHQRQRDLRVAPDHLAHADALQQGEGRGGERRPAGGSHGDPEGAGLPRAPRPRSSVNPQYGVWVPVNASVLTPLTPEPRTS